MHPVKIVVKCSRIGLFRTFVNRSRVEGLTIKLNGEEYDAALMGRLWTPQKYFDRVLPGMVLPNLTQKDTADIRDQFDGHLSDTPGIDILLNTTESVLRLSTRKLIKYSSFMNYYQAHPETPLRFWILLEKENWA